MGTTSSTCLTCLSDPDHIKCLHTSFASYTYMFCLTQHQADCWLLLSVIIFLLHLAVLPPPPPPVMIRPSSVCLSIHFSFTMNITSSVPEGALPRNYTPFTLTRTCWSIYHTYQNASSTYDRIRCLSGGWGGGFAHALNTHHTLTAKHLVVSDAHLSLCLAHRCPHIDCRCYKSSLSRLSLPPGLAWAPLGAVEPYPV